MDDLDFTSITLTLQTHEKKSEHMTITGQVTTYDQLLNKEIKRISICYPLSTFCSVFHIYYDRLLFRFNFGSLWICLDSWIFWNRSQLISTSISQTVGCNLMLAVVPLSITGSHLRLLSGHAGAVVHSIGFCVPQNALGKQPEANSSLHPQLDHSVCSVLAAECHQADFRW